MHLLPLLNISLKLHTNIDSYVSIKIAITPRDNKARVVSGSVAEQKLVQAECAHRITSIMATKLPVVLRGDPVRFLYLERQGLRAEIAPPC